MHNWFMHPELLIALALLPVVGVVSSIDARRRRKVLATLGGISSVVMPWRWPRAFRSLCLLLGLVALVVAGAGPEWGRDTSQPAAPGRDLVVALDCSKSMLAETPSRFERARAGLLELADALRRVGGHRVALVTFAARARLACPLTHDYDHFREVVEGLDPDLFDADLGPDSNSVSGTRIGLGLAEAVRARDARFAAAADILLLSDGDDPARDEEWRIGAELARAAGIPVFVVGPGDPVNGSVISSKSQPLLYDGKEVRTKLDEKVLHAIADRTNGLYFAALRKPIALGSLYLDAIAARPEREESEDALPVLHDRSTWFYAGSLSCLALSIFHGLPLPRRRRTS